jgi:two-component system, OmpR family, sensor histidine kinase VicK
MDSTSDALETGGQRAQARRPLMTHDSTLALVAVTLVATFAGDVSVELGVAAGVPYVVPVVARLWLRSSRFTLLVALLATALTVVGFLLSPIGGEEFKVFLNRSYAVVAIWAVAAAGQMGTQLRRTEESLKAAEQNLTLSQLEAAVFRSAGDPTQAVGPDGRIVAINAAGARVMGVSVAEAIGKKAGEMAAMIRSDGSRYTAYESVIALVLADGEERTLTNEVILRKDGNRTEVTRTVSPLLEIETGLITGVVQVTHDVTAQRQIERAKSEFLAMTSHELKTPLTAIHAAVGLAASGHLGVIPEKAQAMLLTAQTNSDRLLRLVQEIIELERLSLGQAILEIGPCDSRELQNEVAATLAAIADNAEVEVVVEGESVSFDGDRQRIVQALVNLASNALRFSPPSSKVTLASRIIGNDVRFEVHDSGPGIAATDIKRIFEQFQQVDNTDTRIPGGGGLGLAITKGIVEHHRGEIWVESVEGQGSTFLFTIPING